MMPNYLLDSNVWIRYLTGRSLILRQKIGKMDPARLKVCSVVKGELFYGAAKSQRPLETLREQKTLLALFDSYSFDDLAAEIYAQIRAKLAEKGTLIGPNDMMIASIAQANNLVLVTANTREFSRVEGLIFENWEDVIS